MLQRFFLTLMLCSLSWAADRTTVHGRVLNKSTHLPISGAELSVPGDLANSTVTDSDGRFALELQHSVKDFTIRAWKTGFEVYSGVFIPSELLDRDIELARETELRGNDRKRSGATDGSAAKRKEGKSTTAANKTAPVSVSKTWKPTGDFSIDHVQSILNLLPPTNIPDSTLSDALRQLFNQPAFMDLREVTPQSALYRFCRTEQILGYYGSAFENPAIRAEVLVSRQKLIYAQDVVGEIYGVGFAPKIHCDQYHDDEGKFISDLPQPIASISTVISRANNILRDLRNSLISIGLMDRPRGEPQSSPEQPKLSEVPNGKAGEPGPMVKPDATSAQVQTPVRPENDGFASSDYFIKVGGFRKVADEATLDIIVETRSDQPMRMYISNCYMLDENGVRWGLAVGTADSGHLLQDAAQLIPGTRLRSSFKFTAKGIATGTTFTFVCSEYAPRGGRSIIISQIKAR